RAAEVQRHAVIGGEAGAHTAGDQLVVGVAPLRLGVVVDAVGVGQQAEALDRARRAVEAAEAFLEPAQRTGGRPAQNHAPAPGAAQDEIEAVGGPRAEHADDVAAANVDQILGEQVAGEVVLDAALAAVAAKEGD